jgi:hypothetical protein
MNSYFGPETYSWNHLLSFFRHVKLLKTSRIWNLDAKPRSLLVKTLYWAQAHSWKGMKFAKLRNFSTPPSWGDCRGPVYISMCFNWKLLWCSVLPNLPIFVTNGYLEVHNHSGMYVGAPCPGLVHQVELQAQLAIHYALISIHLWTVVSQISLLNSYQFPITAPQHSLF